MVKRLCELDYAAAFEGRLLAMITLTLPGDWQTVCPDGATFKRLVKAWRKRWQRRWGPIAGVWKLEFQRRGAPHLHLLTAVPGDAEFMEWVSASWADVVAHPDPIEHARHRAAGTGVDIASGLRATDPKRVGIYFMKHAGFAAKDYQNQPAQEFADVGRFWGYWGLERAVAEVPVSREDAAYVGRLLRRATAYRWVRDERGRRVQVKNRRSLFRKSAGFIAANDGPVLGGRLVDALALRDAPEPPCSIRDALEQWNAGELPAGMPDHVFLEAIGLWDAGRIGAVARLVVPYYRL